MTRNQEYITNYFIVNSAQKFALKIIKTKYLFSRLISILILKTSLLEWITMLNIHQLGVEKTRKEIHQRRKEMTRVTFFRAQTALGAKRQRSSLDK